MRPAGACAGIDHIGIFRRHQGIRDQADDPRQCRRLSEPSHHHRRGFQKPDNSEIYETVAYRYNGLDVVKELLADGDPVAFVGWHHGAREHADYALVRTLPEIAVFTRWMVQYGKVFSIPMATMGSLGLL